MRYVLREHRDDVEQRCLAPGCGFVNPAFEEPKRNCLRCCGALGAFPAYGTPAQRATRLRDVEPFLRDWAS